MTPHLHTSKSTFGEMGTSDGQTSRIENTERAVTINSSPEANARAPHIDPRIHTADIALFAQFGFEEKVESLANRSGFQSSMIRDVYKHSSTFKAGRKYYQGHADRCCEVRGVKNKQAGHAKR